MGEAAEKSFVVATDIANYLDGKGVPFREAYIIVADRVRFKGDDRIFAGGKVTVDRTDFASRSDSLRLDTGAGSDGTLIGGKPMLRGIGDDSLMGDQATRSR